VSITYLPLPTLSFVFSPGLEGYDRGIMAGKALIQGPRFASAEAGGIGGEHRNPGWSPAVPDEKPAFLIPREWPFSPGREDPT